MISSSHLKKFLGGMGFLYTKENPNIDQRIYGFRDPVAFRKFRASC